MYSLSNYGSMIDDKVRMDPYVYALKAAVGPDSVVLDIGTATGIHALLACKFGARKVYAIEPGEAIHLAQDVARANGYGDRIEFIGGLSTQVSLPEAADVIVSDLRGVLPLFGSHIPSIIDARQRHLAPGGLLIPKGDTLWAALVEARYVYKELVRPWESPYGLSMEAAREIVLNSWSDSNTDTIRSANLLTEPQLWAALDYATIESPNVGRSKMTYKAGRDGRAHGWLIWFDAEIAEGITFSNGPAADKMASVYGRGFFPLLEPVSVSKGDAISLAIQAELVGGEYEWRWDTRIRSQDDVAAGAGTIKADFEQATDFDRASRIRRISERALASRPTLVEEAEIDLFILERVDGATTVDEIARQSQARFPTRFENGQQALLYVYELLQQYQHYAESV
jgi:protein arginine N-methyltransferase 1